jgi:hypothetical protein
MSRLARWQAALAGLIDAPQDGAEHHLEATGAAIGPRVAQGCVIYRNSSRGARLRALDAAYPVCRRVLGEACFSALGGAFVSRVASAAGDLNRFGDGFARFVTAEVSRQPAFDRYPWLGDLITLEWLCHRDYYQDDDLAFDHELLRHNKPGALSIRPTLGVTWMRSPWPVHQIRDAHSGGREPPAMTLVEGDWCLVIERVAFHGRVAAVDPALWELLAACGSNPDLARLVAQRDLAIDRLGELVQRDWVRVSVAAHRAL